MRAAGGALALMIGLMGCDGDTMLDAGADAGATDSGGNLDAGPDATVPDAGPADAGPVDAGPVDAGAADAGPLDPNIAFVTSTRHTGDFGGLAGGDAICNTLASAAGLDGTYVAWLSDDATSALERLGSASGWVRMDGRPFADRPEDFVRATGSRVYYPIRLDELGVDHEGETDFVWTGTSPRTGLVTGTACANWTTQTGETGVVGDSGGTTEDWSSQTAQDCAESRRLYCFGVDRVGCISPPTETGRMVFASQDFVPGGGIVAADAQCQTEATAAGLTGSFAAWLATDGASASGRFIRRDEPVVRPDGVLVASTDTIFLNGPLWDSAPTVEADGAIANSGHTAWGGFGNFDSFGAPGTAGTTCENWTSTASGTLRGNVALINHTREFQITGGGAGCDSAITGHRRLVCLQE